MNKNIIGYFGLATALLAANIATAQTNIVSGEPTTLWFYGAHAEGGVYMNQYGQKNAFYDGVFDGTSGNTSLLGNVRENGLQLNQAWVYGGKSLNKTGWDFGGRADFMFGTDGMVLQSTGFERDGDGTSAWDHRDYAFAFAQLYAEVGYQNISVKFGKFMPNMTLDGINANDRFFYSRSQTSGLSSATLTGIVATWDVNNSLSVSGGWTNGEDSTFDTSHDNALYLSGKYNYDNKFLFGYSLLYGRENYGVGAPDYDYFVQAATFTWNIDSKWAYSAEWMLRNEDLHATGSHAHFGGYGVNQELTYRLNDDWAFGGRVEWARYYAGAHMSDWGFTLGANWTPFKWLAVRPEVRYDNASEDIFAINKRGYARSKDGQFCFGLSAVVKF